MNPVGLAVVTAAAVAVSAAGVGAGSHGPPAAADDPLLRAAVEG